MTSVLHHYDRPPTHSHLIKECILRRITPNVHRNALREGLDMVEPEGGHHQHIPWTNLRNNRTCSVLIATGWLQFAFLLLPANISLGMLQFINTSWWIQVVGEGGQTVSMVLNTQKWGIQLSIVSFGGCGGEVYIGLWLEKQGIHSSFGVRRC